MEQRLRDAIEEGLSKETHSKVIINYSKVAFQRFFKGQNEIHSSLNGSTRVCLPPLCLPANSPNLLVRLPSTQEY